jgi:ribosomal-protein-alanine N-acetyltransferase
MIQKEHQGKGYTFEALEKIIDYGFNEMNLNSIEAVIDPNNSASEKLLQKTKFIKEAHFKEHELWEGKYLDSFVYTRLKHY